MFRRIIVAEDHEIRNLGVVNTLKELGITQYDFASYCDEAISRIEKSAEEENSYDLLITDLVFDEDYKNQNIKSGQELIAEVRQRFPNLKIIVFSIEKKPSLINDLFNEHEIDGFVSKGRNDGKELSNTIKKVYQGEVVIPQEILNVMRSGTLDPTQYDVQLLEVLAKGWKQSEIVQYFKENSINPYSKSAVEKRLNELRELFGAKNSIEMIVTCKNLGII